MVIRLKCPACGTGFGLPAEGIGTEARCPGCQKVMWFRSSAAEETRPERRAGSRDGRRVSVLRPGMESETGAAEQQRSGANVPPRTQRGLRELHGNFPQWLSTSAPVGSGFPTVRSLRAGSRSVWLLAIAVVCLLGGVPYLWSASDSPPAFAAGLKEEDIARAFAGIYENGLHGCYQEFYIYNPGCGMAGSYYVVDVAQDRIVDCGMWRFARFRPSETIMGPQYVVVLEYVHRRGASGGGGENAVGATHRTVEVILYTDRYRPIAGLPGRKTWGETIPDIFKAGEITDELLEPVTVVSCDEDDDGTGTVTGYRLARFPSVVAREPVPNK